MSQRDKLALAVSTEQMLHAPEIPWRTELSLFPKSNIEVEKWLFGMNIP
jgi:hypothetical protein